MRQDWSTPFTADLCRSVKNFCVYCKTKKDAVALFKYLDSAGISRRETVVIQHNFYPCYRFQNGVLVRHDCVETYEIDFRDLPKFTFTPGWVDLPELSIPESVVLVI